MTGTSRADYEQIAARYDEDRVMWHRPADDVVPVLLRTSPSVRALDLGCGTGSYIAAQPADERVRWFGLDASAAMLDIAHAKLSATPLALPTDDEAFSSRSMTFPTSSRR